MNTWEGSELNRYLDAEKRGLVAAVENLWGKYAVPSCELERERAETLKTLNGYLKALGYLGMRPKWESSITQF